MFRQLLADGRFARSLLALRERRSPARRGRRVRAKLHCIPSASRRRAQDAPSRPARTRGSREASLYSFSFAPEGARTRPPAPRGRGVRAKLHCIPSASRRRAPERALPLGEDAEFARSFIVFLQLRAGGRQSAPSRSARTRGSREASLYSFSFAPEGARAPSRPARTRGSREASLYSFSFAPEGARPRPPARRGRRVRAKLHCIPSASRRRAPGRALPLGEDAEFARSFIPGRS